MKETVAVVDLFSGPGGLAEGFAASKDFAGRPNYKTVLSIEMEQSAHRTLLLRSFLRKFPLGFPEKYYDFLNNETSQEPDWAGLFPNEWQEACDETRLLTLGNSDTKSFIRKRIKEIRSLYGGMTVLLGGPPCQSYSIVGRARNAGNGHYSPANDKRQSLYRQYVEVLKLLQPAVAIMENVKGILSAKQDDTPIFSNIMDSLANAGGKNQYHLFPIASSNKGKSWKDGLNPKDFLVKSEQHGIPQKRHRFFVVCIRSDIISSLQNNQIPVLKETQNVATVNDIIGAMPILRSRLKGNDDDIAWQKALMKAYKLVLQHNPFESQKEKQKFNFALELAQKSTSGTLLPFRGYRGNTGFLDSCPTVLSDWLTDHNLTQLPNNETRGHMEEDIARYLYASVYAYASGKSPRVHQFPKILAAKHKNWNSGKFEDRFRVQMSDHPSSTITSHISKDGHYFIHPDPKQCRSLTVREVARLQTFPDNYFFHGSRTQQYIQVGNAVPPFLAYQIATEIYKFLEKSYNYQTREIYPVNHSKYTPNYNTMFNVSTKS